MKPTALAIVLIGVTIPAMHAVAGPKGRGMENMPGMQGATGMQNMPMSEGVIRKVDKSAGKITIRHGELYNLGMPAMTMMFHVSDPAMLNQVKPGDSVRFVADRVHGALTITHLETKAP